MDRTVSAQRRTAVAFILAIAVLAFAAKTRAAPGQTPGASTETSPGPANGGSEWRPASMKMGLFLDGYYSANLNRPASGRNQVRNFDVSSHAFSLNLAKIELDSPAEPLGFRLDLGFGRAMDVIHAAERSPEIIRHLLQAYVAYRPGRVRGLTLDLGKFVTAAGAEVIETHSNWNYSRSLLFALAIPYYHFGVRATAPFGRYFHGGVALVNGWNNVEDNNTGKTLGLFGTLGGERVSWTNCYYGGPEKDGTARGWRHLYDTTVLLNPHARASLYVNFDYVREGVAILRRDGADLILPGGHWVGVAGAARVAVNRWFAVAPRVEWFHDADGLSTGTAQKLKEFTLTGEFRLAPGVSARVEFRRDWSNRPFFEREAGEPLSKRQSTLLVGLMASFGADYRATK